VERSYEAIQRVKCASRRRTATVGIIALLLYLHVRDVGGETAIVMLSLPFALVGGVWIMWLWATTCRSRRPSGSRAGGCAAETGVVMLIYLDTLARRDEANARPTLSELVLRSNTEPSTAFGQAHDGTCHHAWPRAGTVDSWTGAE